MRPPLCIIARHGPAVITYIRGIFEKFRLIGSIIKIKHALCGTVMKIGPVRVAQQTKQCVHNTQFQVLLLGKGAISDSPKYSE
jgi:hypothetical protein